MPPRLELESLTNLKYEMILNSEEKYMYLFPKGG